MMRAHLSRILASLGVLVLAAAAAAWFTLRASLPVIRIDLEAGADRSIRAI